MFLAPWLSVCQSLLRREHVTCSFFCRRLARSAVSMSCRCFSDLFFVLELIADPNERVYTLLESLEFMLER